MTGTISRRTILRAAGAAIALPWLESLPALAAPDRATGFPKRFAVLFMGNGVNGNHWWARGCGAAMTLSRSLQPLEPVKHKINVINGLFNKPSVGNGIHPAQTGNLLSGVPLRKGLTMRAGVTVDQVLASQIGRDTDLPSVVMASERPAIGCHETGFSMAYSSCLSWRRADAPVAADVDPPRAFDRVFARCASGPRQSIVDRLSNRTRRVEWSASAADRQRLDGYLTCVRDVETRADRMRSDPAPDLRDRTRLMCDIVALAFQTNRTRVASMLLAADLSSLSYAFLDVRGDHHSASHDDLSDGYERIVRFHVSQLAYLAERLDSMPEGEGTVLDNCCLLWLSNMWAGWKHDNMKLPVVTAGGLGGTLATGRSLEYLYAGDEKRRLCSLYLSIMERMGVTIDRFGDADRPLENL
ncbi:MAG TPA: DUF1552 domain-containing protein [Vicinamibacterales bacterium]|nr:DUF1552 domain-containing protein [Vicinamibacterales bacterium]